MNPRDWISIFSLGTTILFSSTPTVKAELGVSHIILQKSIFDNGGLVCPTGTSMITDELGCLTASNSVGTQQSNFTTFFDVTDYCYTDDSDQDKDDLDIYWGGLGACGGNCHVICKIEDLEMYQAAQEQIGAHGDPHFATLAAIAYSWHGGCDAILLKSILAGLEIQIRTFRIQNKHHAYSKISGVAAKIGLDTFEVNDGANLIVNGVTVFDAADATNIASASDDTIVLPSGLTMTKSVQGSKKHIVVFNVYAAEGEHSVVIKVNEKHQMLSVAVNGHFPDGQGLLGSSSSKALFARDGVTDLVGEWNTFGDEWQVRQFEENLFQDKDRFPQHPVGCIYDGSMMSGEDSSLTNNLRRRLFDAEENKVTEEDATAACAHSANHQKMEFCVADVLALNDVELAEDSFYAK